MAIKFSRTVTRPNTDVHMNIPELDNEGSFFQICEDFYNGLINSNVILSLNLTISDDNLSVTKEYIFEDFEKYLAYEKADYEFNNINNNIQYPATKYREENKIIVTTKLEYID